MVMIQTCDKATRVAWLQHLQRIAYEINAGTADSVIANKLLADIENGEVLIGQLPVSLQTIENVAGRKLHAQIVD